MAFSVVTSLGEHLDFGDDASFEVSDHGILVIQEPEMNEQLTLSPAGWTGVTEELQESDAPAPESAQD